MSSRLSAAFIAFAIAASLTACGGGSSDSGSARTDPSPPSVDSENTLHGFAQKGPFVRALPFNSEIQAFRIDGAGNRIGSGIPGEIIDNALRSDLGEFRITIDWEGPTLLEARGDFLNEISREFENTPSLLSVVDAQAGTSQVNVNAFTHVLTGRVKALMEGGQIFPSAVSIANAELITLFGLPQGVDARALSPLSLSPSASANANLLLFSASLMTIGSRWRQTLDDITADFADDGEVNGIAVTALQEVAAAAREIDLSEVQGYFLGFSGITEVPGMPELGFALPAWVAAPIELSTDAKILTPQQRDAIVDVASDGSVVRFDRTIVSASDFEPGDVLISGSTTPAPGGLLRRVSSVADEGNFIEVSTVAASLEEVIVSGQLSIRIPLDPSMIESVELHPGVSIATNSKEKLAAAHSSKTELAATSCKASIDSTFTLNEIVNLSLETTAALCATWKMDADFGLNGLDFFQAGADLLGSVTVSATIGAALDEEETWKLARIKLKTIDVQLPGPAGIPIPLTLRPELTLDAESRVRAEASIAFSLGYDADLSLHYEYASDTVEDIDIDGNIDPRASIGSGARLEATVAIVPGVRVTLYPVTDDLVNASLAVAARWGGRTRIDTELYPTTIAEGYVDLVGSIDASVFTRKFPLFKGDKRIVDEPFYMSAVTDVTAELVGTRINVSWRDDYDFPSGTGQFRIALGSEPSLADASVLSADQRSPMTIEGADPHRQYYVRVSAFDSAHLLQSVPSTLVSVDESDATFAPGKSVLSYTLTRSDASGTYADGGEAVLECDDFTDVECSNVDIVADYRTGEFFPQATDHLASVFISDSTSASETSYFQSGSVRTKAEQLPPGNNAGAGSDVGLTRSIYFYIPEPSKYVLRLSANGQLEARADGNVQFCSQASAYSGLQVRLDPDGDAPVTALTFEKTITSAEGMGKGGIGENSEPIAEEQQQVLSLPAGGYDLRTTLISDGTVARNCGSAFAASDFAYTLSLSPQL